MAIHLTAPQAVLISHPKTSEACGHPRFVKPSLLSILKTQTIFIRCCSPVCLLSNVRYYRNEKFIFKNTMIDNLSMSDTKSLLLSLSLITLLIMVLTSSSITLAKTKNDLPRLIGKLGQITIIKKVINDGGGTKKPSDFTITLTANTVTGPFKKNISRFSCWQDNYYTARYLQSNRNRICGLRFSFFFQL